MGYNAAKYLMKRIFVMITAALLMVLTTHVSAQQQDAMTITVKGVSFKMIRVQGGTFTMGATYEQGSDAEDNAKPAHKVTLSTYYIGETEVTQALWQAVMGSNPSEFKGSMRPVEQVNWYDCQEFIRRLNQLTGKKFRLPTEAEWEFAARGGTKSLNYKYSGSNDINTVAWYMDNAFEKGEGSPDYGTHVVKTKKPNELGIYDMSGNVNEWCSDWYGNYTDAAQTNPQGVSSGFHRVGRGGGWSSIGRCCRSSYRYGHIPDKQVFYLGLRLVLLP